MCAKKQTSIWATQRGTPRKDTERRTAPDDKKRGAYKGMYERPFSKVSTPYPAMGVIFGVWPTNECAA